MILLLDEKFEPVCLPVSDFVSLSYEEAWEEPGSFAAEFPVDRFSKYSKAEYICFTEEDGGRTWGRVESVKKSANSFTLGGRELVCILDDFVISGGREINGRVEDEVRALIGMYAPGIKTTEESVTSRRLSQSVEAGSLLNAVYACLTPRGLSPYVYIDVAAKCPVFALREGKDRTGRQRVNTMAVFSDSFGNFAKAEYSSQMRDFKNYVVAKAGKEEAPEIFEFDFRDRRGN